jgi:imidazolonepropionase-like amidohydrolase
VAHIGIQRLALFTLAVPGLLVHTTARAQPHALAITNVTLIDGTGAAPKPGMTVVMEGDRITGIGEAARVPSGAQILDGTGKFLIPGLRDMHAHLSIDDGVETLLARYMASGITGVRDMASAADEAVRLRQEILEGKMIGPRLTVAGPILQGPLPFETPPMIRTVASPEEARRAVGDLWAEGVDFVKVGDTVDRGAYMAIAAEARLRGLPLAGHLPVSVGAAEASRAGQRSIEHFGSARFHGVLIACSEDEVALRREAEEALDGARAGGASPDATLLRAAFLTRLLDTYSATKAEALFSEMAANGTWQVPTLVAIRDVWSSQRSELTEEDVAAGDRLWQMYAELIRGMRAAGTRMLAGTDLPVTAEGSPLHEELALLVEAGLTPMEALQTATRNPAEYLGTLGTEGTVELGKAADLVLLDADPLSDIRNTRRIHAVIVRGRVVEPRLQPSP